MLQKWRETSEKTENEKTECGDDNTGKLNLVDLNRLLGLFATFAQHTGKVLGRISLRFHGIRAI